MMRPLFSPQLDSCLEVTMPKHNTSRVLHCLVALALTLAGCGDSDPGTDAASSDSGTSDSSMDGVSSNADCDELRASGACPEGRVCTENDGVGECEAACEEGFAFGTDGSCTELPNCDADSSESILATCDGENRVCEADDAGAQCGDCQDGFRSSPLTGACVEETCGGRVCGEDEIEVFANDDTCSCEPRLCDDGEASSLLTGLCISCGLQCDAEGESGLAPETDTDGNCVCDTEPGFFWPGGDAAQARECDEDGDRWVNRSALDAIQSRDATVSGIARRGCDLFSVDGVILRNEYAQELSVWSCPEGLVSTAVGAPSPCAAAPMALVEPDRNDSQEKLDLAPDEVPEVATVFGGRGVAAAELNAITKLCVNDRADYDGSGAPDITEAQGAGLGDADSRWEAFTHFSELHRIELPVARDGGFLTIAERSRCAIGSGFSLEYGDSAESDYAYECVRQRDVRYDAAVSEPGFDFARYSCDESTGACPVPALASLAAGATATRPHGLCSDPLQDWGDVFRGMHHHSQFKCVQFSSTPDHPYERSVDAAAPGDDGRHLDFQRCHLGIGSGEFSCDTFPPTNDAVGWGAALYAPSVELSVDETTLPSNQVLGCIDEATLSGLCPASTPVDESGAPFQFGDEASFGELICGCPDTEQLYYRDVDGDGHGDPNVFVSTCLPPAGFVALNDDCAPADADVSPSSLDDPDELGLDTNCDGIDGTASDAVFVSRLFGNAANTGLAPDRALDSIAAAITIAQGVGRSYVLIAEGVYDVSEPIELVSGVNLFGGYDDDATFSSREVLPEGTSIVGTSTTAVVARNLSAPTTVADLTVLGPDLGGTTGQGASIAVVVLDTPLDAQLAFLRTRLEGRDGSRGAAGSTGGVAEAGHAGGAGNIPPSGSCGNNADGEDGENAALGGSGGSRGSADCNGNCTHSASSGGDGGGGVTPSRPPQEGFRSDDRFGLLSVDAQAWRGTLGATGADGQAGGGGGGRAGSGGAGGNGGPSIGIAFADSPILTPFLGLPRQENTGGGGAGGVAGVSGVSGRGRASNCSSSFSNSPNTSPAGDPGLASLGVSTQELAL